MPAHPHRWPTGGMQPLRALHAAARVTLAASVLAIAGCALLGTPLAPQPGLRAAHAALGCLIVLTLAAPCARRLGGRMARRAGWNWPAKDRPAPLHPVIAGLLVALPVLGLLSALAVQPALAQALKSVHATLGCMLYAGLAAQAALPLAAKG